MAERFEKAAESLRSSKKVRIISHYDADGIFSAAILSKVLIKEGISFHITLVKGLDESIIERVIEETNNAVIICDIGSGDIELAEKLGTKVIMLDHHQTKKDSSLVTQINPHLFEMDGADELCGSMLSFLLGITMDEGNWNLIPLALAGGIADKQHLRGFKGANARILEEAIDRGEINQEHGMLIKGNVGEAIGSSIEPYFSFNGDELGRFLEELKIGPTANVEALDEGTKKLLNSALNLKLVRQGAHSEAFENLVGDSYFDIRSKTHINSLSDDVNSCGRMKQEALGIELCFGDREARIKVKQLRKQYEEKIRTNLLKISSEGTFKKDNLQFFYSDNPKIAGAVAGIAMQYILDQEMATFALSVLEKRTKISCRATKYLVGKGLNLAEACKEASASVGGRGGGHTIASGALIPRGKEEKFLEHADSIIGTQYARSVADNGTEDKIDNGTDNYGRAELKNDSQSHGDDNKPSLTQGQQHFH